MGEELAMRSTHRFSVAILITLCADGGEKTSDRFRSAQQVVKDIADRVTKDYAASHSK